jgi:uncharacterized membrane-anchored protein
MKPGLLRALIAVSLALVLVAVNYSIVAKEHIRANGQRIFLRLEPVDPRSLMQGDYMALRFELASRIEAARYLEKSGGDRAALVIAPNGVATLDESLDAHGPRIRYRIRHGQVWLGTNAYFFEEGTADRYQRARYGVFRLDARSGEAVLVGMADENLNPL